MTDRCAHWMELSDRQLLGDELSERQREFLRAHEFDCQLCAREAAVFRELRPAALHVVPSEEEVRRILLQAELAQPEELPDDELPDEPQLQARPTRQLGSRFRGTLRWAIAGASALAVAASALLFWKARPHAVPAASAPTPVVARTDKRQGAEPSSPSAASFSARATEDSCGLLVDGVVLCLAAGSEVGQLELTGPRRVVELKRGRAVASLEPQAQGSSFSIVTQAGDVTAVGTIFSVEVGADGAVYARVTRGKVLVKGKVAGSDQALLAGQKLRLGERAASALPNAEAERDLHLVARWNHPDAETPEEQAAAEGEGKAADARAVESLGAQPSVKDELAHARALRARGQFKQAAAVYRSIHSRSPQSEGGRAALMSLASLQLSALGDPRGALASFESYLAAGRGPLRQQAEYGRIRALRQLGRTAQELEAVEQFVARYPKAPETRLLKEQAGAADRF